MANLIRVKQLDQPDLSGFFNDAFINTGILDATFVDKFSDENISGIKTFIDGVNLNNIDNLSLSGVDITITSGNIVLTNRPTVNGTGVLLSGEAAGLPTTIVYTTGNQTISGVKTFATGIIAPNLLNLTYNTGNQTISGVKTFATGIIAPNLLNLTYNTGDQTISGNKTFINKIYLNNENNDEIGGTFLKGNISGITLSTYQNPTDIKIKSEYVGGEITDIFSIRNNTYTDPIFGQSINTAVFGDQIVIYQTGSTFGVPYSKGPYLRLGGNNIISEKSTSKLGIGTLFPTEKVHISGGNLKVEGNAIANNLVYNTGNQTISGVKTFNLQPILSGNPLITGVDLSSYATATNLASTGNTLTTNLASTGSTLVQSINSLSGTLTSTYATTTNLASTGNTLTTRVNLLSGSAVLITGNQFISGSKTFFDSGVFSLSGVLPISLLNNPLSIVGSGNSYLQLNIQNRGTGAFASADLVITADNGTDSSNFINLGINNVGYNDPTFTNGTGLDGYLFIDGGNLDIGTRTSGRAIEFHAGGTTAGSTIARISQSGLNIVSGNLYLGNTFSPVDTKFTAQWYIGTTSATQQEIYLDGANGKRINMPANTAWNMLMNISVGNSTASPSRHGGYTFNTFITRATTAPTVRATGLLFSGTTSTQPFDIVNGFYASNGGFFITPQANGDLQLQVTPSANSLTKFKIFGEINQISTV